MQGHQVHVISAGSIGALSEETLNGVQVYRVGGANSEKLRGWLKRETPQSAGENAKASIKEPISENKFSGLGSFVKVIHDLTWKKLYWPESNCLWFFPARSTALELAKKIPFDAVISTSTPYTGTLVGKALQKANPNLPWTGDIEDTFCFCHTCP